MADFDDKTLDEIEAHDRDNFGSLAKYAKLFHNKKEVVAFVKDKISQTLKKCGLSFIPMDEQQAEAAMKACRIVIENRKYNENEYLYKSGTYIYKNHEIVGWISDIQVLPYGIFRVETNIIESPIIMV